MSDVIEFKYCHVCDIEFCLFGDNVLLTIIQFDTESLSLLNEIKFEKIKDDIKVVNNTIDSICNSYKEAIKVINKKP